MITIIIFTFLKYFGWRISNRRNIQKNTIEINGVNLYYETFGDPTAQPLIFIHGGGAFIESYAGQIPFFAHLGKYFLIMVDSRAHGRSTDSVKPLSYALIASDIVELIKTLQISPVNLIGWSDGGIVGLFLGLYHPNLLHKMAIIGTNFHIDGLIEKFQQNLLNDPMGNTVAGFKQKIYYQIVNPSPQKAIFLKKIREMWATEPTFGREDIEKITIPTLVMAGENEEFIKVPHTRELAEYMPNSKLFLAPNADHELPIKKPKLTNQHIEAFFK